MRYKLLGKSGLRVSELCLGTMTFGEDWGTGSSKEVSKQVFDAYVEAGGNFLDTANKYTQGTSEKYLGEFIQSDRSRMVVATKYTGCLVDDDPNSGGNHRKSMVQSVEASLKKLNTDYIDLLWLHAWDYTTPIEEVMRALDDLVRAGKVLYVGASDTPAWIVAQANTMASLQGWTPFIALQNEYSLLERTSEREYLPMAEALDLAITPWSPLGGGVLTGKYNKPSTDDSGNRMDVVDFLGHKSERNLRIAAEVVAVAEEIGRSPAQVALAWIRQKSPRMIPIIGARKLDQLKDNMAVVDLTLDDAHMKRLDDVSHIDLGFPHDFLTKAGPQSFNYGTTLPLIDDHRGKLPKPAPTE